MDEYRIAIEAAKAAGEYLENNYNISVDSQFDKDIKLAADKSSERIIIDILANTGYTIMSEETGVIKGNRNDKTWIVDPLDGSANYWKGMKELSCTSIALWEGNTPILGVVYRFNKDEMYSGIVGEGAWLNGKSIETSSVDNTKDAVFATGFPVKRDYSSDKLEKFIRQVQNFKKVRMLGAAAVMGSFVASGKVDAYIEEQIMLWDIAASSAIVKAAGGVVDIELLGDDQCICKLFANKSLYSSYLELGE